MNKQEFLKKLETELKGYFNNRDRSEAQWWLAVEEFASKSYYEALKKETSFG